MKKITLVMILLVLSVLLCACKEGSGQVCAYLNSDLSEAEQRSVAAEINQLPGVQTTEYVTAEEALEDFVESHEDSSAFSGVDTTYLRSRVIMTVNSADVDGVVAQLAQIDGVDKVIVPTAPSVWDRLGFWLQELVN